jgi:hypothetical protein
MYTRCTWHISKFHIKIQALSLKHFIIIFKYFNILKDPKSKTLLIPNISDKGSTICVSKKENHQSEKRPFYLFCETNHTCMGKASPSVPAAGLLSPRSPLNKAHEHFLTSPVQCPVANLGHT